MDEKARQTDYNPLHDPDQEDAAGLEAAEPEICKFYLIGKCRFGNSCRNFHKDDISMGIPPTSKTQEKPQKKTRPHHISDDKGLKKPPMKTSSDIISRILWDDSLNADYFTIGYIDRFLGIIEKPFTMFDWSDLAAVDLNTLAIPKHRIKYFKYKHRKIWDKTERLDLVFGSTGSKTTITDFMAEVDAELELGQDSSPDTNMRLEDICQKDTTEVDLEGGMPNNETCKPNYFLALRITNGSIISNVKTVQHQVREVDASLVEHFVPVEMLHVTLALLRLESTLELRQALKALNTAQTQLQHLLEMDLKVEVKGLLTFRPWLLCASVAVPPVLRQIISELKILLGLESVQLCQDHSPNTLHTTIVKSRNHHIDLTNCLTEVNWDTHFGTQKIESIFLCSMSESEMEDGFYRIAGALHLGI